MTATISSILQTLTHTRIHTLTLSRLDRLISLLETGSTPLIKQTAAKQLGQIAIRSFGQPSTTTTTSATQPDPSNSSPQSEDAKPAASGADGDGHLGMGLESEEEWKEVLGLVGRVRLCFPASSAPQSISNPFNILS